MPINFIPNDPLAIADVAMRQQSARPNRPTARAGFNFFGSVPQQVFPVDTSDFLFWQCREAALAAIETWEGLAGNLVSWARSTDPKKLDLLIDSDFFPATDSRRLNAFYDGEGLNFFIFDDGTKTTLSGQSTDTVSHETGHALLDAIRPDLWQTPFSEVSAFHEGFADCVAILTALSDRQTRQALLAASPSLDTANFVDAGSEYLSEAIRRNFGNVSPSKPRRALNTFKWQLPQTLPPGQFQDPPELLSREFHSFSRVFTGCFYDTLRFIFTSRPTQNETDLLAAAQITGKLLIAGAQAAPEIGRFFRAVGRGMVMADQQQNGGANRQLIGDAFRGHNIDLGTAAMLTPTAALAGPPPTIAKTATKLAAATARDLRERIRALPGAKLAVSMRDMFGTRVAETMHRREVDLGHLDKRLKGVIALAAESVLVGSSGARAAVLGSLPEPTATESEVSAFVETLLENDRIELEPKGARAATAKRPVATTHAVRTKAGKKVLTRLRFFC